MVLEIIFSKITILKSITFRRMTPPKVMFLRPHKVLGAQKSFLGPSKHKKNDILKKCPSYNSSET